MSTDLLINDIMQKKRYKCPVEWCRRYKFHLHCEDISKQVKKNFHFPMKHYGTFERVSDVMKPFGNIFRMIQPSEKRTYTRRVDTIDLRNIYEYMGDGRITHHDPPDSGDIYEKHLKEREEFRKRMEMERRQIFSMTREDLYD